MAAPEPYVALYRRYRPQRFADLAGQEHLARALSRAVAEGKVAHAYLFSGPRGTGKTSAARILAMAANCEAPRDGEPCGSCEACCSVRSGSSFDVAELDAASKRRLEDMRELLASVPLTSPGQRKVYIVDEVHQLTADAASALLKTLEEPPSHVTFVLATTEPEAVPETVRSRCQHFSFGLLGQAALAALVRSVADDAGLGLPADDLAAAVAEGAGSARDALSALERIVMGGGRAVGPPVAELAQALAERDAGTVLAAVAKAVTAGFEPRQIAQDLLAHLRQAFLSLLAPSLAEPDGGAVAGLGRQMGLPHLVRTMETLGKAGMFRASADPRTTLEATLLACAAPPTGDCPEALAERVERLEAALGPLLRPEAAPAFRGPAPPAGAEAQLPAPAPPEPAGLATAGARGGMAGMLERVRARHMVGAGPSTHREAPQRPLNGSHASADAAQAAQAAQALLAPPKPQDGAAPPAEPTAPAPGRGDRQADAQAAGGLPALCAEALDALKALAEPFERLWSALEALAQGAGATEGPVPAPSNGSPRPAPQLGEPSLASASAPPAEDRRDGRAVPAAPEPVNRPDAVQMVLDAFPGAVELAGDAISPSVTPGACPGCGSPVTPAPGAAERGLATLCLPCYERKRAEGRH